MFTAAWFGHERGMYLSEDLMTTNNFFVCEANYSMSVRMQRVKPRRQPNIVEEYILCEDLFLCQKH